MTTLAIAIDPPASLAMQQDLPQDGALPDAPLPMPTQQLERRASQRWWLLPTPRMRLIAPA